MDEFLNEEKQKQWTDIELNTYLAQARIDEGELTELLADVPLPESFTRPDLQLNLWMSSKS